MGQARAIFGCDYAVGSMSGLVAANDDEPTGAMAATHAEAIGTATPLGEATMALLRDIRSRAPVEGTMQRAKRADAACSGPGQRQGTERAYDNGGEAAVLELLRRGKRNTALELLMKAQHKDVYRFSLSIVKDRAHAEDVCQAVFLQAYKGLPSFAGESSLRTWLLGIARYRSLDVVRVQRRDAARLVPDDWLVAQAVDARPRPQEAAEVNEALAALEDCLEECLSTEDRHYISLRYYDGLSYEEMSMRVGKKADTLQARISRALTKLRRSLERRGVRY